MQTNLREKLKTYSTEALTEALKKQYTSSLWLTAKYLLNYKDLEWETHAKIIQCLESPTTNKLIVCPRGSFKSSLCVVSYSIWNIFRNPNIRILIDSETFRNSKAFLTEITAHLKSEKITKLFGPFEGQGKWNEHAITINQRTKPLKEPTIECAGVGVQKTGHHYDLIIADDLNSEGNTYNPDVAKKVIDHYKYFTSLLDPGGTMAVVGTRYSANDVIGHIINNELDDEEKKLLPKTVSGLTLSNKEQGLL